MLKKHNRVKCALQTFVKDFDDKSYLISQNKVLTKSIICKVRENFDFAIVYGYSFLQDINCGDGNSAKSLGLAPKNSWQGSCISKYFI